MDVFYKQILDKVLSLFRKYGIRSITMHDVSNELGISKRTLYQYIKDKEELVRNSIAYIIETGNCFHQTIRDKNLTALEEILEMYKYFKDLLQNYNHSLQFDLQKYYPEIFKQMQESWRDRMLAWLIENIEKGKKEGVYRSEIRSEIVAKLQIIRIEYVMTNNFVSVHDFLHSDFFYEAFSYHIYGICTPQGIELFKKSMTELNFNKL